MLSRSRGKRLIRPLNDPLSSNVDPASRRHLPVHGELERFQAIEFIPRCPMRYKIRIRHQYTQYVSKRAHDTHRLASFDKKRLVILQAAKGAHHAVKSFPTP